MKDTKTRSCICVLFLPNRALSTIYVRYALAVMRDIHDFDSYLLRHEFDSYLLTLQTKAYTAAYFAVPLVNCKVEIGALQRKP